MRRFTAFVYSLVIATLISALTFAPFSFSATTGVQIDFLLSQVRNASGSLAGGSVYFYSAGTTTSKDVYLDINKVAAAANPYTLDANGTALLYGDGTYRIVIKTSAGVTVYDRDNIKIEDLSTDLINAEYVYTLRPKGLIGNDTGNITGYDNITATTRVRAPSIGSSSYTDNGYFNYSDSNYSRFANGPWLDVTHPTYGAKGDGVTDDTAAIQAALAAANVSAGADGYNKTVYVPPGIYLISGQLVIPYGVRLIGSGARSTKIKVSTIFAALTSTGAIRLGDGTATVFGTSVEHLYLDCNNIAGSIGIYSSDVQDNSGVKDVLVNNWVAFGIKFDGSAAAFGSVNNFYIVNAELYKSNTGGAGGVGVYIKDGTFGGDIRNNVVFGRVSHPLTAGYQLNNYPGTIFKSSCDGDGDYAGVDCVKIDNNVGAVLIVGLLSNYWDNAIHTSSIYQVVATNTYRTAAGGTNTIVDDGASGSTAITITDAQVPLFVRGDTKSQFNGINTFRDVTVSTPGYGIVLTNLADNVTKRVYLNPAGDNLLFETP